MLISCGIQWLLQAARYFSQAQAYLNGTSWFKSARQLMICLSSTWMRAAPISRFSSPVAPLPSAAASGAGAGGASGRAPRSGVPAVAFGGKPRGSVQPLEI